MIHAIIYDEAPSSAYCWGVCSCGEHSREHAGTVAENMSRLESWAQQHVEESWRKQ